MDIDELKKKMKELDLDWQDRYEKETQRFQNIILEKENQITKKEFTIKENVWYFHTNYKLD